mgnify:CR=1 FL=1
MKKNFFEKGQPFWGVTVILWLFFCHLRFGRGHLNVMISFLPLIIATVKFPAKAGSIFTNICWFNAMLSGKKADHDQ